MGIVRTLGVGLLALAAVNNATARAAGPVETNPYAVQGVAADESDITSDAAKTKALLEVQVKAFAMLAERLGGAEAAAGLAKTDPKQIVPMLKSLSIEEEKFSPGHYQGKFTVRFLPERIKPILAGAGIKLPADQGPAMLVVPVWQDEAGKPVLWEDNPWRAAWLALNAEQAQIPLIIPLGDQDDTTTLTPQDALNNDAVKLEALRRRYDVKTILVAFAQPDPGGGIHARMSGISPLGKITFDKVYVADTGTVKDSAILAAQRFHQVMEDKFHSDQSKIAAAKAAVAGPQSVAVFIPFESPTQWNGLRARIIATPGIVGVDVTSLDIQGATAALRYNGNLGDVQNSFQSAGLRLQQGASGWQIQPL